MPVLTPHLKTFCAAYLRARLQQGGACPSAARAQHGVPCAPAGNNQALTQVDPIALRLSGYVAFLVWRSVYITKQVSFRNRVLILFDWVKTRAFDRDLSSF